jgi:hypothetical protein
MNKDDAPDHSLADETDRPAMGRLSIDNDTQAKIRGDLDRLFTEKLLAQRDSGEAFTRNLAAANLSLPSPSEIDQALNRLQSQEPSREEVARLLSLDHIGDITVDGMRLNELLDNGIGGAEERKMLKHGILFLKRKMYAEAAEWWRLNRPENELINGRLYLLLTLFLVLTYKLAGNEAAAQSALQEARSNRLFKPPA